MPAIGLVTLVVDDAEAALAFFVGRLGFERMEDTRLPDGKRWLCVGPPGGRGAALLIAEAQGARQQQAIGAQTGGRVAFFLETDNFARDHAAFSAAGVRFLEDPRHESYGTVAVFEDCCGNLWDLIEHRRPDAPLVDDRSDRQPGVQAP